ncbi:MAG TPA: hypothetical protein VHY09_03480 [Candidatus Methylacidiphilales bacterium]|jgi:hypothetical protein|nr:hypothetical protein [Candidatus Methylacidiphilales bacterium]
MAGDFSSIQGLHLCGDFLISGLEFTAESLTDALGRPALARTRILGREIQITLLASLTDKEKSVSLYHEILEAMPVAVTEPPAGVMELNERDFKRAAYEAHDRFGEASLNP